MGPLEQQRLEFELWSALHHVAQLLMGRAPRDVAWWLRANHPEFVADSAQHVVKEINRLADEAEAMGGLPSSTETP